jgi:hypothetical protein
VRSQLRRGQQAGQDNRGQLRFEHEKVLKLTLTVILILIEQSNNFSKNKKFKIFQLKILTIWLPKSTSDMDGSTMKKILSALCAVALHLSAHGQDKATSLLSPAETTLGVTLSSYKY